MFLKLIVTLFVLFAVSRVYLRFREGSLGLLGMVFWSFLWVAMAVVTWSPQVTDLVANRVGIGRGIDVLVYASIVGLLYGCFRLYIKMEFLERELTSLVRNMAIRNNRQEKD